MHNFMQNGRFSPGNTEEGKNVQKKSDTLSSRLGPGVVSPGERINVSANIVYVIRGELFTQDST